MNCVKRPSIPSNACSVFTLKLHNMIIIIGKMLRSAQKDDDEIPSLKNKHLFSKLYYAHA